VKAPGAAEVGRRVYIRAPTARDRDDFLALMRSSRGGVSERLPRLLRGRTLHGEGCMSERLRRAGFRREGFSTRTIEDVRR